MIVAAVSYCSNYVIGRILLAPTGSDYRVDFRNWEQCATGNINFLVLAGLLVIGVTFVGIGCFRSKRVKQQYESSTKHGLFRAFAFGKDMV